jgi:hypothetical protein
MATSRRGIAVTMRVASAQLHPRSSARSAPSCAKVILQLLGLAHNGSSHSCSLVPGAADRKSLTRTLGSLQRDFAVLLKRGWGCLTR